jgi:hypothetical protein
MERYGITGDGIAAAAIDLLAQDRPHEPVG